MIAAFVRHGMTAWNEEGRMQGRRDVPLSARGEAEVRAWRLPSRMAGLLPLDTPWVSSPLRRAIATAEILAGATPLRERALIEMDWGEWEGFTLPELRQRHGDAFVRNEAAGLDFRPPGGESPRDVQERVVRWLIAESTEREGLFAVSHKGVLRALLAAATGWDMTGKAPLRLRHGALHIFAVESGGGIEVREGNVTLEPAPAADTA
jgi:2,3-bisphosphoglycerate-dependent phosphoglycerate mutase